MKHISLVLTKPESWFYENGYLSINLRLFSKYLSAVFSKYLGESYSYQEFAPTITTDKNRPIWQQGKERKKLAIISPKSYEENQKKYNEVRTVCMVYPKPHHLEPFTTYTKEYPSMFTKLPIKLDEKDFLLYFGSYSLDKADIILGQIKNSKFIPTNIFPLESTSEIIHSKAMYSFVNQFIRVIFNYKVLNKKPNLDDNDMAKILEEFGISRKEKLTQLLEILQSMKTESTQILLGTNSIEKALELKRIKKENQEEID